MDNGMENVGTSKKRTFSPFSVLELRNKTEKLQRPPLAASNGKKETFRKDRQFFKDQTPGELEKNSSGVSTGIKCHIRRDMYQTHVDSKPNILKHGHKPHSTNVENKQLFGVNRRDVYRTNVDNKHVGKLNIGSSKSSNKKNYKPKRDSSQKSINRSNSGKKRRDSSPKRTDKSRQNIRQKKAESRPGSGKNKREFNQKSSDRQISSKRDMHQKDFEKQKVNRKLQENQKKGSKTKQNDRKRNTNLQEKKTITPTKKKFWNLWSKSESDITDHYKIRNTLVHGVMNDSDVEEEGKPNELKKMLRRQVWRMSKTMIKANKSWNNVFLESGINVDNINIDYLNSSIIDINQLDIDNKLLRRTLTWLLK